VHPTRLRRATRQTTRCALGVLLVGCASSASPKPDWTRREASSSSTRASAVDIEWLSVTNVYLRVGALGILIDGYVTRLPASAFVDRTMVRSRGAVRPDSAAVARVLSLLGGRDAVQVLLTGHSHFDHAFDTPVWATLTGANVVGSPTTCLQLAAAKIPAARFQEVDTAFGQWKMPIWDLLLYIRDNEIHHRGQGYVYLRSLGIEPPHFWER